MSCDADAVLLAAAIRAACLAKAPRRTIQAIAAAVTGVLRRPTVAIERRKGPRLWASADNDHVPHAHLEDALSRLLSVDTDLGLLKNTLNSAGNLRRPRFESAS